MAEPMSSEANVSTAPRPADRRVRIAARYAGGGQTQSMRPLLVAFGGAAGALLRWGLVALVGPPLATLAVNVVGAFLVGVVLTAGPVRLSEDAVVAVSVGFLGAFTTFSALTWDALRLEDQGRLATAVVYVTASVVLGLVAVVAGRAVGERLLA